MRGLNVNWSCDRTKHLMLGKEKLLTSMKTINDFANADLANLMLLRLTAIFMNFFRFSRRRSNRFKSQFGVFISKERFFLIELVLDCRKY